MIIYDSKIARLLQGRLNPYDYVTLPLVTLTALPYGEKGIWEEMEMSIHRRQYTECFVCPCCRPCFWAGRYAGDLPPCRCSLTTSFTGLNAWLSAIQRLITRQKKRARK